VLARTTTGNSSVPLTFPGVAIWLYDWRLGRNGIGSRTGQFCFSSSVRYCSAWSGGAAHGAITPASDEDDTRIVGLDERQAPAGARWEPVPLLHP
jgi:hypothetical protein